MASEKENNIDDLIQKANKGDSDAQYELGVMYYNGEDVEQDSAKAFEWYKKAADRGNKFAQYSIGCMYINGNGVEKNAENAFQYYKKAAEQGDVKSQYLLGSFYKDGTGVKQDYKESFYWFEKAAMQNDAYAQNALGWAYSEGLYVEQDYSKAFEWHKKAAEQGDAYAQWKIGIMYDDGRGVEQDYGKALLWYMSAAEQGDDFAQYKIGEMYYHGKGVERDYAKAFEWFERGAIRNEAGAQFYLGCMYNFGEGVVQDYRKAVELFKKSAEQGHETAQFNLGWMYYEGEGTEQSYETAVYWWEKSASQGDAEAQFCISCMYRDGLGVEQNAEKAKELWEMCKDSIDFERFYVLNEKFPKIEAGEEKTSMCNDNEYEIENVKIVSGTSLAKYWRGDMQVVATDKGDFIDKMPNVGGHDWQKEIGKCIECEIRESKGHKWISLLSDSSIYNARITNNAFDNDFVACHEELPPDYDLNENPELVKAYEAIKQNTPVVFLTGGAGTGKSTFIKYLKNNLKSDMNKSYIVLAPTGVAAINVGGQTIHSFFRWNNDVFNDEEVTKGLYINSVIYHTDLIIIDEISMVHSWMMDHIDYALRLWCDKNKPFGGKQLLLIGDCFQLPPVVEDKDLEKKEYCSQWESPFFFAANSLKELSKKDLQAFQLRKIYRQENDQRFINILNRIRECKDGYEKDVAYLNENCLIETRLGTKNVPPESLLLCTTNAKADEFNNKKLFNLVNKGKQSITYKAFIEGDFHYDNKQFLTKDSLDICVGAKIMVTKNISSEHLVNGDMGIVLDFGGSGNSPNDYVDIEVKGTKHHLTRQTWEKQKYEWNNTTKTISQKVVGTFNQIPLTLGWAVTIHKSQGLTLDSVAIDAPDAWDSGQIYVALSRAKSLNGILLCQRIPVSAVKVADYVVKKYSELFPETNENITTAENDYTTALSNDGFTIDKAEEQTKVTIGGINLNLYPNSIYGESIQDHVKRTMVILLENNLIPEAEMKRLQSDKDYCYSAFGIVGKTSARIKYILLSKNKNDFYDSYYKTYRCWANKYGGYYICAQWYPDCKSKFARWLIELSKGNLNLDSISLAIKNDAPYIDVGRDKTIGSKEDDIEFVRRSFVNLPDYLRDDAWMDFYEWKSKAKSGDASSSLNKDARKPSVSVVHEETIKNKETSIEQDSNLKNKDKNANAKTKIPLHTIKAKRKAACLNGCCQFIKEDGSLLFAEENGNLNEGLPWANEMVELSVYAKIDNKITVWSWKKIS